MPAGQCTASLVNLNSCYTSWLYFLMFALSVQVKRHVSEDTMFEEVRDDDDDGM